MSPEDALANSNTSRDGTPIVTDPQPMKHFYVRSQWFALFSKRSAWGCNLSQRHVRSPSVQTKGFFVIN